MCNVRSAAQSRPPYRPRDVPSLLVGLAVLCLGCDNPDSAISGESAMADSAQRAMAATDFGSPVDHGYVLGLDVPPYPPGVESISAGVLRDRNRPAEVQWGVDHVRIGGRPALLLKRVVARTREPIMDGGIEVGTRTTPTWRVEDVLLLPEYGAEDRVVYSCSTLDGETVAALGVYRRDLRTIRPVRSAWVIDRQEASLVTTDPAGIRCGRP